MYYWDMWQILGIAPTTDKKAIRKAYAVKTREIHPEEKPEEFRQLHEAYQQALGYADNQLRIERIEAETGRPYKSGYELADEYMAGPERDEEATEEAEPQRTTETAGEAELISYFGEQQEKHQQSVDAFIKSWKEFQSPYHNPEVMDWWKEYLASEEFQAIRYHSQVLHLLAEEINDKFFYGINEVKLLFWDAYGFREEDGESLQGEEKKLWKCLYPAYAKQEKDRKNAKEAAKAEKVFRIFAGAAAVLIAAICLFAFTYYRRRQEESAQYLAHYMTEQYAGTSFSEPERAGTQTDGSFIYVLHSEAHPELEITAQVKDTYEDGKRDHLVIEDYQKLLLEYYAPQYGLEAGRVDYYEEAGREEILYSCLLYGDSGQIDDFCGKVTKMFREQKELQGLAETAVYTENILYPMRLLLGGETHVPFARSQIYDLRTADAAELAAALKEAHMIYMFQYESWNITPAQYREWGAAYEKICGEWENDDGEWYELYDQETGELLCRLFIFTYDYIDGYYSNVSIPRYMRGITVGNAYYYLLERGAKLSVDEDGGGFRVSFYGNVKTFGWEPEVEFNELQNWY